MKLVILLVMCGLIGVVGNAKSTAKSDATEAFLSYSQFLALTPSERISYIKDIRRFVQDLTKENDSFAGSAKGQALYAMINMFQSEVWAQSSGVPGGGTPTQAQTQVQTQTQEQNPTSPTAQSAAGEPTQVKDEGGGWFIFKTQPPAPGETRVLKRVQNEAIEQQTQPSSTPSSSTPTPTKQAQPSATTQPTSTTEISPAQALANKWAEEDSAKPCPGSQVGSLSKMTNFELANLIEAGIRACTVSQTYVVHRPEKPNNRGVYRPAAVEDFVAVVDELDRRSKLNYKGKDEEDFGLAVYLMRGTLKEFNDPEHRPKSGTYNAEKIAKSVSRIDDLVKKVDERDRIRGSSDKGRTDRSKGSTASERAKSREATAMTTTVGRQSCLAAGFINRRNSSGLCPFYSQVPYDWFFGDKDPTKFACINKEEIVCNPFLYGYALNCEGNPSHHQVCTRVPVCVAPSKTASEACFRASSDQKSLQHIKMIWGI